MSGEGMLWGAEGVLVAGLAAFAAYRPHAALSRRELAFGEEVTPIAVLGLLRHIAAIREGPVSITVCGEPGSIRFMLAAPPRVLGSVIAAGSGLMPELQLPEAPSREADPTGAGVVGVRVGWAGAWPLLRQRAPELSAAAVLGVLGSVAGGERLRLLVRLWPVGRVNRPVAASERRASVVSPWFARWWWPAEPPREDVAVIRAKYSGLLLRVELIVIAEAGGDERATALTQRLVAALRSAGGTRGTLRYRRIHRSRIGAALARQRALLPGELSTVLCPEELVGIVGLPVGSPRVPGVSYGVSPRRIAVGTVPSLGRVIGCSSWPAQAGRVLAQPLAGALAHTAIVGPTGSGKSTLVAHLVEQDLTAGRGALVLDLKGDLVADLLARIPEDRMGDVVVLEPARGAPQPGLSLFPRRGDPELTADLLLGTLRELFADSWGVRSSQYLGLGLRTLALLEDAVLTELPGLFSDRHRRAQALAGSGDGWLAEAWARFDALTPGDRAAQLSAPLAKLQELISRRRVRAVLGQRAPRLDFHRVLADRQVVLVSLPPGLLGTPATRLLAALTLWQFFQAVEARASLPRPARTPFMAYVDEVAVLANLPLPLEGLLERARGHGVGVTLAPQALSQLSVSVRASVLANAGTVIAFGQNSEEEAGVLARSLPGISDRELQHLAQYEVLMRLAIEPGQITPVMSARTLPISGACSDPTQVRARSTAAFAQPPADTENRPDRHPGPGTAAPALGVKRRQQ